MSSSDIWVVIPAAGIGSRMESEVPKQYLELAGKTILEHSLSLFLEDSRIKGVVLVLHPQDTHWKSLNINHRKIKVISGGDERVNSVLNGLKYIQQNGHKEAWVMVHDAARPCLSSAQIDQLIQAGKASQDGAILATPAVDTVKYSSDQKRISNTLDRKTIWLAQTPQFFPVNVLLEAIKKSLASNLIITDEASAMELQGFRPILVKGSITNLKITEADDLKLAAIWLKKS